MVRKYPNCCYSWGLFCQHCYPAAHLRNLVPAPSGSSSFTSLDLVISFLLVCLVLKGESCFAFIAQAAQKLATWTVLVLDPGLSCLGAAYVPRLQYTSYPAPSALLLWWISNFQFLNMPFLCSPQFIHQLLNLRSTTTHRCLQVHGWFSLLISMFSIDFLSGCDMFNYCY